jgi:hypothetical protein
MKERFTCMGMGIADDNAKRDATTASRMALDNILTEMVAFVSVRK